MPRSQVDPPTDAPNGTGSGVDTGNPGSGGVFDPGSWLEAALEWLQERAVEAISEAMDIVPQLVNGMAAPGDPRDPASWREPTNGLWPGVYDALPFTYTLAFIGLIIAGALAFRHGDAHTRRRRFYTLGVCTVMVLLTEFVAPMGLHIGSIIGRAVAPSGAEFAADPGSVARFGLGFLLAVLLIKVQLVIVIIGLFVLAAQYFLTHLVLFLWPIGWALRAFDGMPRSLGDFVVYLYGGLIALNVGQALVLRLVFELPWGTGGVVDALLGFLGTTAGLAFALIWLPKSMLVKVTAGSAVGLGVSTGMKEAGQRTQQAQQAVSNIRSEQAGSGRGTRSSDTGGRGRSPAADTGRATRQRTNTNASSGAGSGRYVNVNSAIENAPNSASRADPQSTSRGRRQTRHAQRDDT